MAKLPQASDLGPLPIDGSRRPIASASVTVPKAGIGLGLQEVGKSFEKIGAAFQREQDDRDRYEYANAHADLMKAATDLDTKYLNDTDYTTRPERYSQELDSVVTSIAPTIKSERNRNHFLATAGQLHSQHIFKQTGIAQKQGNDDALAQLENEGQSLLTKATDPDPMIRRQAQQQYHDRLVTLRTGPGKIITAAQEIALKRKFDEAFKQNAFASDINGADATRLTEIGDQIKTARPKSADQINLREAVKKFEGYSPRAYSDFKQHSIGYGTRASHPGETITRDEAEARLDEELKKASDFVDSVNPNLPAGAKAALTSLTYNAGGDWANAGLGEAVRSGDMERAKERFVRYTSAGGKPLQALIDRRAQEVKWFDQPDAAQTNLPSQSDATAGARAPNPYDGLTPADLLKLQDQVERRRSALERTKLQQSKEFSENVERNIVDYTQGKVDKLVSREEIEAADIDPAHRNNLLRQQYAAAEGKIVSAYERRMLDAAIGKDVLPTRREIESDRGLSEPHRNSLLNKLDTANAQVQEIANFKGRMAAGERFNPFDTNERKVADVVYQSLGGTTEALNEVVSKTGILPKSAATGLRSGIYSNDPERVAASLTVANNLINSNRNIFTGVEHGNDFENNAIAFQHYVDTLGMSAQDAAKRIIRDQSPEYQAQIKAKIKAEDIDAKLKKEVSVGDLAHQFDGVPWIPLTDPNVGFDPGSRQQLFAQYSEVVKDRYLETGNLPLAKRQAADALKKTWGVSSVNGSKVVMPYPPERAPAYAGIENAGEAIASQAIASIKERTGSDVQRGSIRLSPIPGATAQAYKNGAPVPYMLIWQDKNGVVQMLNPGQAFVADPKSIREEQSARRKADFDRAREFKQSDDSLSYAAP